MSSTVKVSKETKGRLDALKVHPRETYEQVIKRLIGAQGAESAEAR